MAYSEEIKKNKNWERKRDGFIVQIQRLKMEIDVVDINLEECEGFCIGEYESRGCTVIFDNTKNKISSNIDFTETKVEKCSVVRDKKYKDKMTLGDKMAKKKDEVSIHSSAAEYLTYVAAVGDTNESMEMRYKDENIWLTQKMMAQLYDVSLSTINEHIKKYMGIMSLPRRQLFGNSE